MKKFAQRFFAVSMLTLLLTQVCYAANANEVNFSDPYMLATVDVENLTQDQLSTINKSIQMYSNEEYDEFLAYMVNNTDDHVALREDLALVGVEISEIKEVSVPTNNNGLISPLTNISNATLYMYDSTRTGSSNIRASASYQLKITESRPGSLDAVIFYYDSTKASYVSHSVGANTTLKDGSKAPRGTLVFNFNDQNSRTNYSYCTVEVSRKASATGKIFFCTNWIHSYLTTSTSVTLNPSVTFGGSGAVSGSIGASINFSPVETTWQLSDIKQYNA
ncbi:MAG: hypothetical protein HFE99_03780 [Ruminiclostridium sp.]|jgi:hypothetical protein|nr:hypothetical protein [Ruminiclostridium sp.]